MKEKERTNELDIEKNDYLIKELELEAEQRENLVKTRQKDEIEDKFEEIIVECPKCGNKRLIQDYKRAELFCENCGFVIDDNIIDQGPEWRAFDNDQRMERSRAGPPATYTIHDKGLSTVIDWADRDFYGKTISSKNKAQLYRLRKWQRRIRVNDATERNLAFALSELDRMASALSLPRDIRETAALIYRRAVDKNLIRGRSIEGVASAALYAACRECGVPRTLNEITSVSRVSKKEIGRTYRFIVRELSLSLSPVSPTSYISRFCSELNLNEDVKTKSLEILEKAKEKELTSGKGPTGVAAAAIYIAAILSGDKRTQREVSEVVGVTEVTIRNRYKELTDEFNLDISL